MNRISELVEEYPDIDLSNEDTNVVFEIATRWLREQSEQRARFTTRRIERQARNPQAAVIRRDAAVSNAINEIVRKAAVRIESEWVPSLLARSFSLPDGRVVTWGSATIAEHETRRRYLENQAAGIAETAGMHQRAIDQLRLAGTSTLNDMERAAA